MSGNIGEETWPRINLVGKKKRFHLGTSWTFRASETSRWRCPEGYIYVSLKLEIEIWESWTCTKSHLACLPKNSVRASAYIARHQQKPVLTFSLYFAGTIHPDAAFSGRPAPPNPATPGGTPLKQPLPYHTQQAALVRASIPQAPVTPTTPGRQRQPGPAPFKVNPTLGW